MRPHHVITPGDHFSPRTGSAIPTVVDGLCRFAPADAERARVVLALGTYPDRYDSADAVEYAPEHPLPTGVDGVLRLTDPAVGRLGRARPWARRMLRPAVADQGSWAPGVIVGHNMPALVPLVENRRHRTILYVHNDLLRTYGRREAGRVLDQVDAVVCVSRFMADRTASRLPASLRSRVQVVPNGVDVEAFRPDTPRVGAESLRVVYIGRVTREKGVDLAVEAVRLLGRRDIELTVIGSHGFDAADGLSDYERTLRRAATRVAGRVRFVPFVGRQDVPSLLAQADVVVVPSRFDEPFGLTVLEAMASGCAVIGARVGGIPEALGGSGFLVEREDARAMAQVLSALADDGALLASAQRGCAAAAERQHWSVSSARFHAVVAGLDG